MKKSLLTGTILCILGIMAACNGGNASDNDTITADTTNLSWTSINDKLIDGTFLTEEECLFIITDTTLDDGNSEGVGNSLFKFLRGNKQANEMFSTAIYKGNINTAALRLMDLMSIDIFFKYNNYNDFIADFPVFSSFDACKYHFYQRLLTEKLSETE